MSLSESVAAYLKVKIFNLISNHNKFLNIFLLHYYKTGT